MKSPKHPKARFYIENGIFSSITCFRELEIRIEKLSCEKARGDAFEVFSEAYLATQSITRAKEVEPENAISPSIRTRLGLRSGDDGLDGIILTHTNEIRGYQVKFRTNRAPLTWSDVATFFGVSDRCHERLLITNSNDISSIVNLRKAFSSIRGYDFDSLTAEDFERISAWLKNERINPKQLSPRAYQTEALEEIISSLQTGSRATAVMACGTGKTNVGLWVAEGIATNNVLVLVPSLALMRQTLKEWINHTKWKKFDYLCVCSDPGVTTAIDSVKIDPVELQFSVTTDHLKVHKFISHPHNGLKIIFTTYQSSTVVAKGIPSGFQFNIGIFDEAHKTAGNKESNFSFALSDENLPIVKRLFLTATPRHYNISKRDQNGEPLQVYSMDQPEIYGPIAYKLPFSKAAEQGIICKYKVVISVVRSQELEHRHLHMGTTYVNGDPIKTHQVANQIATLQMIEKYNVRKIITYHRNIVSAKSFTSKGPEGINSHQTKFSSFHINGQMSMPQRESTMREFRTCENAIISNSRCLTEGVDVPSVDMVAFLAPKKSKVDIVQATGRAMRPAAGKTMSYILVPLYIEQAHGESLDEAARRSNFGEILEVLQALLEHDDNLNDAIHELAADLKLGKGFNDANLREYIEIIGTNISLEKLKKFIAVKCLETLARPWQVMIKMLLLFKEKFSHTRVPKNSIDEWADLGQWVDRIRSDFRNGHLSNERKVQLEKLGIDWRVDGQTLDDTTGLLNEKQIIKSGFSNIARYRKEGRIKPIGIGLTNAGLSPFYDDKRVKKLKEELGITLDDTTGFLNETHFRKESGFSRIERYRKGGQIIPKGYALTNGGLSPFYGPEQIEELRKSLGITLNDTNGLINEEQFIESSGLSEIAKYRKQKIITPRGFAMGGPRVGPYYHPNQIKELKERLGITLDDTTGLLNEKQIIKSGLSNIANYRRKGQITPKGYALTKGGLSPFYSAMQVENLKKELGITLEDTTGLLNESRFREVSGISGIHKYRQKGLIVPVGFGMTGTGVGPFYHPKQIKELKARLGISLDDTTGLLNENQFMKKSGFSQIVKYRKRGLIVPLGTGMTSSGIGPFYHPSQIVELKKAFGITLDNTNGLQNEKEIILSGFSSICKHREEGRIKPKGYALTNGGLSPFYAPQQIEKLKKDLGITLNSTHGLLSEKQVALLGIRNISKIRRQGIVKPFGFGISNAGVSPYYHRSQIPGLKKLSRTVNH